MSTSPDLLVWAPNAAASDTANVELFRRWSTEHTGRMLGNYDQLHAWSVSDPPEFWTSVINYFDVPISGDLEPALVGDKMPEVQWFPHTQLNYVAQVLRHADGRTDPAIVDISEDNTLTRTLDWPRLRHDVGRMAYTLRELGVSPGDRVVGYLPNIAEAVIAFLATASLGATWSSCGQDYSAAAAVDRLGQLEPVVFVAADGYRYGGKQHDRRAAVDDIRTAIPSIRTTILVSRLNLDPLSDALAWNDAIGGEHEVEPIPVPFGHPLWVLFSSGTTGRPKGIVHGHGGVVLEHLKQMSFHLDLTRDDTYFWYTSPSWMMWNFQVAGLLVGSTIVCYDGSPSYPGTDGLWELAARYQVTVLGTSPAYLQACEKEGITPAVSHDLSALGILGSTGSVLPPGAYEWVTDQFGSQVQIASMTGGTDVVSAFAGALPSAAVYAGQIPVISLGASVESWVEAGRPAIGQVGEMVITKPMPSMPLHFWNDSDGCRYHDAYFSTFPGVWRHGDFITITERGSLVVHGRSDSTLNRNGVRMGSADIYQVVEALPEIREALVIGAEFPDGSYWMPLFVVMADGVAFDDAVHQRIRSTIRNGVSARHLPDVILKAPAIPHTRTGKKLEIPVKRLIQGDDVGDVADPRSIDDEVALQWFVDLAHERARHSTKKDRT